MTSDGTQTGGRQFEHGARVVDHANGGYTRVALLDVTYDGGEIIWEVPTESIPRTLRAIGSLLRISGRTPNPNDDPSQIRATLLAWTVTALGSRGR